jgi:hypothetical protein
LLQHSDRFPSRSQNFFGHLQHLLGSFQLVVCNLDRQIEFIGQLREVLFRMSQLRLVLTQDRSLTPSIKEPSDAVKALALA